jgi:hypothetical protein
MLRSTRLYTGSRVVAQACLAMFLIGFLPARAQQHHAVVEWYAELTAPAKDEAAALKHRPFGRVTVTVDFPRRVVIFHTDIKERLAGLRRIEVRTDRARGDFGGPAVFTIFDAHEGRLAEAATRTVEGAAFDYVATPILNSRAAIAITTEAHPDGEIVGQIVMHKRYE